MTVKEDKETLYELLMIHPETGEKMNFIRLVPNEKEPSYFIEVGTKDGKIFRHTIQSVEL